MTRRWYLADGEFVAAAVAAFEFLAVDFAMFGPELTPYEAVSFSDGTIGVEIPHSAREGAVDTLVRAQVGDRSVRTGILLGCHAR